MTHQELDDLFRANSDRGEFAPEPGEWEAMTALLDEDERKERYARWVSIAWMSLFFLLIAGGIYGLWVYDKNGGQQPEISSVSTQPIANIDNAGSLVTLTQKTAQAAPESIVDASISAVERDEKALENSNSNTSSQVESTSQASSALASNSSKFASQALAGSTFNTAPASYEKRAVEAKRGINVANPQIVTQETTLKSLLTTTVEAKAGTTKVVGKSSSATIALNESNEPAGLPLALLPSSEIDQLQIPATVLNASSPKLKLPDPTWSRFGLGLFVAQEYNSVAMSSTMRLGTRAGLQLRYNPTPRWSIDLGASYAHKSYMAPKGEMQNTLGLFFDDVLPAQTDGECDILEIPLTLTFLPKGHGKAGPFISGGLLSYRIFREEMVFHYDQPTTQTRGASAPDKGAFFGTTQLQVGYQFVPNKGPAWRVGPYLHVPISMVGSGDLPIYSVGLQLGVELF